MNLYEQQSSWNSNMPLRGLFYFSSIYQGYIAENNLDIYSSAQLKLATPRYIIFYNGLTEEPDRQELRLTASFTKKDEPSCLECVAQVVNINFGHNKELMTACKKLYDYSYFIAAVRKNLDNGMVLKEAVDHAVSRCIQEDVLKHFLTRHRAEVTNVILEEYNEELHEKTLYEQGRAAGIREGQATGRKEGKISSLRKTLLHYLSRTGNPVSDRLKDRILSEPDPDMLEKWLDMAFGGASAQELENVLNEKG